MGRRGLERGRVLLGGEMYEVRMCMMISVDSGGDENARSKELPTWRADTLCGIYEPGPGGGRSTDAEICVMIRQTTGGNHLQGK